MDKIIEYTTNAIDSFKPYCANSTITQADGDTGDSAQRIGTFFALCNMINAAQTVLNYDEALSAHTESSGVFRRSPISNHWGFSSDNFSRDQWQAIQLAAASSGDLKLLKSMSYKLVQNYGLHQNGYADTDGAKKKFPDIAHPNHISVFIRGMSLWMLWPVLVILDLFFLGDLLLRKSVADYDNILAPQMLYANLKYPTPVSKLATRIYAQTDFITCLENYHSNQRNGILPFPALFWIAYVHHGLLPYEAQ